MTLAMDVRIIPGEPIMKKNIVLEYDIKNDSMVEFELSKKEFDLYMKIHKRILSYGYRPRIKIKELFHNKNGRIIECKSLGEKMSSIIIDDLQ